jgi:hypothetical protein
LGAGFAVFVLAQAFLAGLLSKVLHPAQGYAVVGQAAGVGRVVGEAALPLSGKGMGGFKLIGHGALLAGFVSRTGAACAQHAKKLGARKTERFQYRETLGSRWFNEKNAGKLFGVHKKSQRIRWLKIFARLSFWCASTVVT